MKEKQKIAGRSLKTKVSISLKTQNIPIYNTTRSTIKSWTLCLKIMIIVNGHYAQKSEI